jgi:hypothetical protein
MSRFRPRVTYANVTATLALVLALTGGAYAATQLPKNSIGHKQIKKNSIDSSDVKNRSLLSKDFKAGQLPTGPQGSQGAQGVKGDAGQNGFTNLVVRTTTVGGTFSSTGVDCLPGERAVGGGASRSDGSNGTGGDVVNSSFPEAVRGSNVPAPAGSTPTAWHTTFTPAANVTMTFYVVCASP